MKLFIRLCVVAGLSFLLVALQAFGDKRGLHLPWYFLQQIVLVGLPMAWLLKEVMPREDAAGRLAFLVTSAGFIALASAVELVGIERRFWWFSQDVDRLVGLRLGEVPIEEFLAYPLLLNLPILFYLYLKNFMPAGAAPAPWAARTRRWVNAAAALCALAGLALFVLAFFRRWPPLDLTIVPKPDAAGAIRYEAGPPEHGWTIVQLWGLGSVLYLWGRLREKVDKRRLVVAVTVYLVFAFYVELMACGRGWWVWNARQVLGVFTWVLPVESYVMYLTGALYPVLVYEWLRPFFAPSMQGRVAPQGG